MNADAVCTERHLRDIVALSTLPWIWSGANPQRIAESLAAAVFTTLSPDLVYVAMNDARGALLIEVAQIGRYETSAALAREAGPCIQDRARTHDPEEVLTLSIRQINGGERVRIIARPLGLHAERGVVAVGFNDEDRPAAFDHLVLNVAASQAATAVQNTHLLDRAQEARNEAEALQEIARTLGAELDLQALVQRATDAATRLTLAKFGAFFYNVTDPNGESYLLYTLSGAPREAFERFGIPRNTALFNPTFTAAGIVRLDDVLKDPRYGKNSPHFGMPKGHLPVRSYLAVPVVSRSGQALGGMFFGHPDAGVFTERAERLALGIAAQAAIAIDNARLYSEARESEKRFRMVADNISQLAWTCDTLGNVTWYNQRWLDYTGMTFEELKGWDWKKVQHPDHVNRVVARVEQSAASGEPWEDTFPLRGRDGTYRWFLSRAVPIRDGDGKIALWFGTNTDVTAQLEAEEALRRHRESLEETVRQRTAELEASRERLHASERFAALGTLAAGLGHDLGNLIMPLRVQLEHVHDRLKFQAPPEAQSLIDQVASMRAAAEYLQNLTRSLRLMAIDPDLGGADSGCVELKQWWIENEPLLRTAVSHRFALEHDIPDQMPPVEIAKHLLTQLAFNLVQNAGQALAESQSPQGRVRVTAALDEAKSSVTLTFSDNGPGMTAEVKRRCLEPFFTTKTRGISTGMGLALVNAIIQRLGGGLDIKSQPGQGASFIVTLPVSRPAAAKEAPTNQAASLLAAVQLADGRSRALATHLLESSSFAIAPSLDAPAVSLLITESGPHASDAADDFLRGHPGGYVILIGDEHSSVAAEPAGRVLQAGVTANGKPQLRSMIRRVADQLLAAKEPSA